MHPMFRRFLLVSCKRTLLALLVICVGCSAQLAAPELSQRIENRLRVTYNVPADVKVLVSAPHASDFPNYDSIKVTFQAQNKKQEFDFLLSKDQKTLIRMTKMDLSQDPYQEIMRKIDTTGRPVRGNPNAKVVVVNYDDFECPYCAQQHSILFPALLKEYGDRVAFIYKDFPLSEIHPWAIHAAVDANCLAAQSGEAYWNFADYVHANHGTINSEKNRDSQFAALDGIAKTEADKLHLDSGKLEACEKDPKSEAAVSASGKEGEALNVNGTPTMFVNGRMLDGARPASEIKAAFDTALQRAGVAVPGNAPTATLKGSQPEITAASSTAPH